MEVNSPNAMTTKENVEEATVTAEEEETAAEASARERQRQRLLLQGNVGGRGNAREGAEVTREEAVAAESTARGISPDLGRSGWWPRRK